MHGFNVEIRYLKGSRRATIRVFPENKIKVTVPFGFNQQDVDKILLKKSSWIQKTSDRLLNAEPTPVILWQEGQELPFLGKRLKIKQAAVLVLTSNDSELLVPFKANIKKSVLNWYRMQARQHLEKSCLKFAGLLGVEFKNISVRTYRSRWGSCSNRGDLSFNWQIITFAPDLFEYVVAHEICHLREMNHSPRFYQHLQRLGFERKQFHPRVKQLRNIF